MLPVLCLLPLQYMNQDIYNGKEYHFAENNKNYHVLELPGFCEKMRREAFHRAVYGQFAHSHNGGYNSRMKQRGVPFEIILGKQENKIHDKI